jgi:hypothetical protein
MVAGGYVRLYSFPEEGWQPHVISRRSRDPFFVNQLDAIRVKNRKVSDPMTVFVIRREEQMSCSSSI